MSKKRHKPEEIVAKLRQVDVWVSQGKPVAEAVCALAVTDVTYYRWRQEYGGLKGDQVKRLKDLECKIACNGVKSHPISTPFRVEKRPPNSRVVQDENGPLGCALGRRWASVKIPRTRRHWLNV